MITNTMISLSIAIIGLFLKTYLQIKEHLIDIDNYEKHSIVNRLMKKCIYSSKADRFLILKITNGASKIVEGQLKRYRVSCINEEFLNIKESVIDRYQQLFVDDNYKTMIEKSYKQAFHEIITKDYTDCDLKTIYLNEGIEYARVYYLHDYNDVIYFCSISYYQKPNITKEIEQLFNLTISQLKAFYKHTYK